MLFSDASGGCAAPVACKPAPSPALTILLHHRNDAGGLLLRVADCLPVVFSAYPIDSSPLSGSQSSGTHGLHGIVGKVLASSRGHRRLLRTSGSSCQNSTFGGHAHGPARREPLYGHRPLPHNILHLAPASIPSVLRAWFSFVRPYLP